jgi:glycosyltransferase involved in cell wall biosynthesis
VIEKRYLKSVDGIIFNSQTTREVVNKLIGSDKPNVIGYPPTDRFGDPIPENEIVKRTKSDELRILFLGNVIHRKGLHTLLEAINSQRSTARLDVVGSLDPEPEYASRMQTYVIKHGLSSVVSFYAALDEESLVDKLRAAHVLVVPSNYEGYGIVYLEGMGFGLPAIGTTAGAAREIITDSVDGFLIEPGDSNLLASRLRALQEDRELLARMSLAARKRYLGQPKWSETADRIREYLRSFLG